MQKILVIAAHPDDEILGMGGSIAKFVSEGKQVYLLIVTDGSSSQYRDSDELDEIIKAKQQETLNAAKSVGISDIYYGGLPDMKLDVTAHVRVNSAIESILDKVQPDTVFTHFWGDVNKDHQAVYESTMVAVRPLMGQIVREVYCYSVPSSTEWNPCKVDTMFMPNMYVDITNFEDEKCRAMQAYTTELREYPHPRSLRHLQELDKAVGLQVGLEYAESFVALRIIVD